MVKVITVMNSAGTIYTAVCERPEHEGQLRRVCAERGLVVGAPVNVKDAETVLRHLRADYPVVRR
jgi:hypothetical protein